MAADPNESLSSANFRRKYNELADEVIPDIEENLQSMPVSAAVGTALVANNFKRSLTEFTLTDIENSYTRTAGLILVDSRGFRDWWLHKSWNPDQFTLSETIAKTNYQRIIATEIRKGLFDAKSWTQIATSIDNTELIQADLPKHLDRLTRAAKRAFDGNLSATRQYRSAVSESLREVNRLAKNGAPNRQLKAAYQDVIKATETGSQQAVSRAVDRAVKAKARYNAERISRTERARAYSQAFVDQLDPDAVGIKWNLTSKHNVVDICDLNAGADLYGMGAGVYPPGKVPAHPAHPHCILPGALVDVCGKIDAAFKAFYNGRCVKITLSNGRDLSVTENHPIMTTRGFKPAHALREGNGVMCCSDGNGVPSVIDEYNDQGQAKIEDIFSALKKSSPMPPISVPPSPKDLHNDGQCIKGNINIVGADSLLLGNGKSLPDDISEDGFIWRNVLHVCLDNLRFILFMLHTALRSPNRIMSLLCNSFAIIRRHILISQMHVFRKSPHVNPEGFHFLSESRATYAKFFSKFLQRFASKISINKIVDIRYFNYSGHVYDLHSKPHEIYICNGVVVKNCHCNLSQRFVGENKGFNPKGGEKYLKKQSANRQNKMMGIEGAKKFRKKPETWRKQVRMYNPDGPRAGEVPQKFFEKP